jgi:predicted homoserine dehydrogenase-like protein
MHLTSELRARDSPVRVGVVGAGVFGTKLMNQVAAVDGLTTAAVADLDRDRAVDAYREAGVPDDRVADAADAAEGDAVVADGARAVLTDGLELVAMDLDVVVEATGLPEPGAEHAYRALRAGTHVVMVTVETDVVVGPYLAEVAERNGVTYSLAYGDQPALLVELVEWARLAGLDVVAAGKGTPFVERYRYGVPDDALERWGFDEAFVAEHSPNPKMYNSFLDGTKAAVEMCAVANATDLDPDVSGLHVPPASIPETPDRLRPAADGGVLSDTGVVDMVSTLRPDGSEIDDDMDANVFVVTTTENRRAAEYLAQKADGSNFYVSDDGAYQVFYRAYHLPGTETTVSVARAALRNEATGAPRRRGAEVAAMAKRDLDPGDTLDGGGGYTVSGYVETRDRADAEGLVPFGLLGDATVVAEVAKGESLRYDDVEIDEDSLLYHLRRLQDQTVDDA